MKSTEKVQAFLEELSNQPDEVISEISFGVAPYRVRLGVMAASSKVPTDPDLLDAQLLSVAQWCLGMRSDDAPALDLPSAEQLQELSS